MLRINEEIQLLRDRQMVETLGPQVSASNLVALHTQQLANYQMVRSVFYTREMPTKRLSLPSFLLMNFNRLTALLIKLKPQQILNLLWRQDISGLREIKKSKPNS